MPRDLGEIAREIMREWPAVSITPAGPYVFMMVTMHDLSSSWESTDARTAIRMFLDRASVWRGPVARRVKHELRAMCGFKQPWKGKTDGHRTVQTNLL